MTTSAVTIWTTTISGNYLEFRKSPSFQILIKMYSLYVFIVNVHHKCTQFLHFLQILQIFSVSNSLLLIVHSVELQCDKMYFASEVRHLT